MIAFWLLSTLGSKATHVIFHIRFILGFGAAYALVFEVLTFEFHSQYAKPLHTYKLRTVCLVSAHYAINGFSQCSGNCGDTNTQNAALASRHARRIMKPTR